MKLYESVPRVRLIPKLPVICRVDGKAFHSFTRGLERPYDGRFNACMWEAAKYLCEQVQGAKIAYVQSDEISVLLVDYQNIKTQPWFEYELQKMCSVAAGMASAAFMAAFVRAFPERAEATLGGRLPAFDARLWNLPKEEVCNYFIWRQQDATRNSIQALAQAHFSHRELHLKDQREMQEMLFSKGINWNDCPVKQKRGACVIREAFFVDGEEGPVQRHRWEPDLEIPVFTQDRGYIDRHAYPIQVEVTPEVRVTEEIGQQVSTEGAEVSAGPLGPNASGVGGCGLAGCLCSQRTAP